MLRIFSHPARLLLPGLFVVAALIQACGSDSPVVTPGPRFSFVVGTSAISLSQASATSTYIKATRSGGLTGPITYAISGAPTGLTVSVVPTSVSDSSALAVTASAALGAGTYPIVVSASAAGAPIQQASIAVTVTAVTSGAPLIRSVVAGAHTCALTTTAVAYCWGYNNYGQLGNGDTSIINPTPIKVAGGLLFAALFVSKVEGVSCGVTAPGVAYCWGNNGDGELGDGTRTTHMTPAPVTGGLTFRSFAVGTFHTCGLAMDGTAYCWGFTNAGAFGDGSTGVSRPTPTVAAPGMKFDNIVAGQDFTCGLTLDGGAAYCWGRGPDGELGNGTTDNSATPVPVSGGLTFQTIVAGGLSVCGLTTGGKAYCWGDDFFGTLGDGSSATDDGVTRRLAPVEVAGGLTFKAISAGYRTVCGIVASGAAFCWGDNGGSVGDGTLDHRSRPTAVLGGLTFQSISVGTGQTCGVTTASALYCWGGNNNGELGDGTTDPHATPAPVRWP